MAAAISLLGNRIKHKDLGRAEPVADIQTSEDVVINAVGRELDLDLLGVELPEVVEGPDLDQPPARPTRPARPAGSGRLGPDWAPDPSDPSGPDQPSSAAEADVDPLTQKARLGVTLNQ